MGGGVTLALTGDLKLEHRGSKTFSHMEDPQNGPNIDNGHLLEKI